MRGFKSFSVLFGMVMLVLWTGAVAVAITDAVTAGPMAPVRALSLFAAVVVVFGAFVVWLVKRAGGVDGRA